MSARSLCPQFFPTNSFTPLGQEGYCCLQEALSNPRAAALPLPSAPQESAHHPDPGWLSTCLFPPDLGTQQGLFSDSGPLLSD